MVVSAGRGSGRAVLAGQDSGSGMAAAILNDRADVSSGSVMFDISLGRPETDLIELVQ